MKNLSTKIVNHLETQNHINPNICQINAISEIESKLSRSLKQKIVDVFKKEFTGIYLYGSVGVGKSVILKALNLTVTDINAGASDLYRTLIELKMINEIELVRSILTEYLIHFSNS